MSIITFLNQLISLINSLLTSEVSLPNRIPILTL